MTRRTNGFTMIEMMLAMTFVSFLMVAIALTTIFITQTYQRGITVGQVSEAGRTLIADMQQSVGQAQRGQLFKWPQPFNPQATGKGAICFGNVSYVWNTGQNLAEGNTASLIRYQGGRLNGQPVRLAKVNDMSSAMCSGVPNVDGLQSVELLAGSDRNLAVQAFDAVNTQNGSTQSLYRLMFTIGTNDRTALENNGSINDVSCRPPTDLSSDLDYCAVNSFDFIVRAGGGK